MARLPKVKLRAIPVFPASVTGGNAIEVTKTNGIYSIDVDVSDIQIAAVPAADVSTIYAISWGSVTDNNPEGTFQLVPYSGLQGASADLTSLADLGTNGLVARIGDADYTTRTLTAGTGLGVTNGDGVAGNPTVAVTDVELLALAGLTSAADRLPYFTGSGTASLATFTSFARTLVDDADATAARTTLGLTSPATTTPAALTRVDDTNVTLTLGGTPTTALLQATSVTVGWTGTLAVARGGTGAGSASGTALDNITGFSSTGILVRTASGTYAFRTATGTSNRLTVTNGDGVAGNPTFDVSTSYAGQASITTLGTIATGTWSATTVAANKGGTGATSYAVGDILYADTTSTLAKLADIATGNALISGGVGAAFSWGKIGISTHVSGLGAGVATLLASAMSAGQYPGEPTTGSASAGNVGQYIESIVAFGSAVSLTSTVAANITSISLTAGDWEVTGLIGFVLGATTNVLYLIGSISNTSATLDTTADRTFTQVNSSSGLVYASGIRPTFPMPMTRISLSGTTTIYLVAAPSFTVSTCAGYGILRARRAR